MNTVHVDFSRDIGAIRPLHGVNSGPRTYSFFHNTTPYFIEAGIPFSRLHDTEYPYGSGHFVDIPCVFKDFDADPADPGSYDFAFTDMYIAAIAECGTDVIYRLGASIEHAPVKRNIYPPKDPKKWAEICAGIVRHYNEGWADGFHYGIKYWEIWNEPEGEGTWRQHMWMGSDEEYFQLYTVTANRLKGEFPDIKVGGYASCGFYGAFFPNPTFDQLKFIEFAHKFFRHITAPATRAPLDFFSWHIYTDDLYFLEQSAQYALSLLKQYGLESAESVLDEWNYAGEDMFNRMRTEVGASMAAGALCAMQKNGVDVGAYYDSQPAMCYCGIFSLETRTPTKTFYALKAWNELYRLGREAACASDCTDLRACAAFGPNDAAILISSYRAGDPWLALSIQGFASENGVLATVLATDRDHTFEVISEERFFGGTVRIQRKTDAHTMLLVRLKKL